MYRRAFLTAGAIAGASLPLRPASAATPVIDTHIHLYDPSRPEGVPWPPKSNTLIYKPTLPGRFREVTKGLGVVGAIAVECSPWLADNQWLLDVSAKDEAIVGVVGNLEPDKRDFGKHLERYAKNPLFLGIRYGYLWGRDLGAAVASPELIHGLRMLWHAGLVLDTANPSVKLLRDVVRISDRLPDLRIVVDHLPALPPPAEPEERKDYDASLRELGQRPQVYTKLSAVLRREGDRPASRNLKDHEERLDLLYETFGPDRVLFGSDWPNSDPSAPYDAVLGIMREYFRGKGKEAAEKFFWRNSAAAYRWKRREDGQPDSEAA